MINRDTDRIIAYICCRQTPVFSFVRYNFAMEMKNAIAREGREAKNLILYHLSSEDESKLIINQVEIHLKLIVPFNSFSPNRNEREKAASTYSPDRF